MSWSTLYFTSWNAIYVEDVVFLIKKKIRRNIEQRLFRFLWYMYWLVKSNEITNYKQCNVCICVFLFRIIIPLLDAFHRQSKDSLKLPEHSELTNLNCDMMINYTSAVLFIACNARISFVVCHTVNSCMRKPSLSFALFNKRLTWDNMFDLNLKLMHVIGINSPDYFERGI